MDRRLLLDLAHRHFDDTVRLRRQLHRQPELSFEEHETARRVSAELEALGLEPQPLAGTGVVAHIVGALPGPTLALRADLDALPIEEATGLDYASETPGVMHACGHDVHTASLLAAARLLVETRHALAGTVRLVFQPGEEKLPGGATKMIQAGVLDPMDGVAAPVRIVGQHVTPLLPAGTVGVRSGPFMASADELYLTLTGRGGHAADPAALVDPVLVQAHVLVALQAVISRRCPPGIASILSFGRVEALGATNVVPDTVQLTGTFRSMDEAWRAQAHQLIRQTAEKTAEAFGAACDVEIRVGYPSLANDPATAEWMRRVAVDLLGAQQVVDVPMWYASEDFAWYTERLPGCFYVLGVGNEAAGLTHGLHTPRFAVDEEALRMAPALLAALAHQHGHAFPGR